MSIFDFLSSNLLAANIVWVVLMVVILIYLIAFLQGRSISFWPPKIGQKPSPETGKKASIKTTPLENCGIIKTDYFTEFSDDFNILFENSENITLYFIHSRRWRENHIDHLADFLEKRQNQLTVILPNLANAKLIQILKDHFDDGQNMEAFIKDAYRYFASFLQRRPEGINVRLSDIYPTYSFYKFDEVVIVAMYPTSPRRKNVPTFQIMKDSKYWDFISNDVQWLLSNTKSVNLVELQYLINQ
ncbi:hypothetical protein [Argonema antarcticum]|uniref:hypothetical protein n=1 Tax=Argonema antarcticum TaxID=2942763 RepID=UPI002013986C|nr:hypothetical protein [Argonema antarcticum]MCL1473384.1 hypothetical protein [Argonema antarcticum A004/B2]